MYSKGKWSQDKNIVIIFINEESWDWRSNMKGRNKEESCSKKENCNITSFIQLGPRLNMHRPLLQKYNNSSIKPVLL